MILKVTQNPFPLINHFFLFQDVAKHLLNQESIIQQSILTDDSKIKNFKNEQNEGEKTDYSKTLEYNNKEFSDEDDVPLSTRIEPPKGFNNINFFCETSSKQRQQQ